jgi:anti-anti-sigma factor
MLFTCNLQFHKSGAAVLRLGGHLNAACIEELSRKVAIAKSHLPKRIVIDATNVATMNSSGIGFFISTMQVTPCRFVYFGFRAHILQQLHIMKLDQVWIIAASEEVALTCSLIPSPGS